MEYTAWVEATMNSMAEACDNSSGIVKIQGFSLADVMRLPGFADAAESLYRRNTDPRRAVEGALFDLETMGLLKVLDRPDSYVVTNRGHQFSRTMERLWHEIMGKWLSADPTPALLLGTLLITVSVAGAIMLPIPNPRATSARPIIQYWV